MGIGTRTVDTHYHELGAAVFLSDIFIYIRCINKGI